MSEPRPPVAAKTAAGPAAARDRDILTPSRLNSLARELVEGAFPLVWVEGEISNCARPASGHLYFTLKDAQAQVRCAMFKLRAMHLRFRPSDGAHVLVRARASLYEARGEFQLIAEHMEEAGEGALRREFERLKARLSAEGLFETARKRPLPRFPRRLGVITSPTGAAIRDVLSVLGRRYPLVLVEVLPVPVQGAGAGAQIASMLAAAAASGRFDVLLLTRGGGSLEDLWAFNDEQLARAIHAAGIPVVSAIGHEIDFTIADFVADLRAPTPSAAAELLVPSCEELRREFQRRAQQLAAVIERRLRDATQASDGLYGRLQAQRPQQRLALLRARLAAARPALARVLERTLARRDQRLELLLARLRARDPRVALERRRERLEALRERLLASARQRSHDLRRRIDEAGRALHAMGPLATLDRGYALLLDAGSRRVVRSVAQVAPGQSLIAKLGDGELAVQVVGGDA